MRAYSLLLRLYPASFRNEYGAEMRALFARRRREAPGLMGGMALWMYTIGEVAANAALVHWDLLKQDVGYTIRMLRRMPGFAITAVLIVAIGVGATTAAFSVTDFVLIRPLPFPNADRLVKVWQRTKGYGRLELSPANYRDWTQASTVFERIGMYHPLAANLVGAGEPLNVAGAAVSVDLFPTLGVQPLIGRLFVDSEDREGVPGATLLSYRLWQTQFGGDPGVLGRQLLLDNEAYTVIGVMPREFRFPSSEAQLWTPTRFGEQNYVNRNDNWLQSVGRLRPGVTLEQARAELELLAAQSQQQYPAENVNVGAAVFRFRDEVSQQSRLLLVALSGAAACVLLIACANLANLLLARALGRRRGPNWRAAAEPLGAVNAADCQLADRRPSRPALCHRPDRSHRRGIRIGAAAAARRRGGSRRPSRERARRRRPQRAPAVGSRRRGNRRLRGAARLGGPAVARAVDRAGDRSRVQVRGCPYDADRAARAAVREGRDARGLLRTGPL